MLLRMQLEPAWSLNMRPVDPIAKDRQVAFREVHPHLVRASGAGARSAVGVHRDADPAFLAHSGLQMART